MRAVWLVLLLGVAFVGCGPNNLASNLVKPPDFDPKGMAKCRVQKSQTKPLIVEWPSAERRKLEASAKKGLVVARYLGCELKLLTGCTAPGRYGYTAYTPKKDTVRIKNEDDLYANMPVGAAKFEAKLATSGELGVQMTLVGRYLAENHVVRTDELKGSCDGATHLVAGLTVGAFEFFAGQAKRETLSQDGDAAACQASAGKEAPPKGCAALIRIQVIPLECALGTHFEQGKGCVADSVPEGMVLIPAGSFWMGCAPADKDCYEDEKPRHEVVLDAFYIDKTEVTVRQYRRCVPSGACTAPGSGGYVNSKKPGREDHPVNYTDWHQASAYCRWAKKRLPTEAEWEKAARGTDDRIYPWGNQPPSCQYAVMRIFRVGRGCGRKSTWPVGSKPAGASPYGVLDMVGNVREWVADYYDRDYYQTESSTDRNPSGPSDGEDRVFRGGGWSGDDTRDLRISNGPNAHTESPVPGG